MIISQAEIKVYGQVQRVNFRHEARLIAQALGILGFVQNLPDGSLFLVAQGDQNKLRQLIEWCKKGPSLAKVTNLKVKFNKSEENFKDFEIR